MEFIDKTLEYLGFQNKDEPKISKEELDKLTAKDWQPIKNVKDGIVCLKSDEYIKIIEIQPINFDLKSKNEKKMILYNYRSFLKACKFPMQISVQCRKANVEPHLKKVKGYLERESNPNVQQMISGYIKLVKDIGNRGAISRNYYIIVPYVKHPNIRHIEFTDVKNQLTEKQFKIAEYIKSCGNEVIEHAELEFELEVLYSYLNRRTRDMHKIGNKFLLLMSTLLEEGTEEDIV